ncbi:sodium-coupled monocarboxylate transporter 1 [Anastrepha obliqua]|uniref:sodium-coupled monocarboxylate transporter 1 n=1 Tax=Anastrepha obliqua TaxID=95512 RepID=UPI00240A3F29|nr:sodium-coupled monocarboxylate transporter 1 [Anastrepha obliqua]
MSTANETVGAIVDKLNQFTFGTIDYIVFLLMLSISLLIGIYFGFFGHGADNTEEYLLGGRRMKTLPTAISLVASQLSAISIMTIPTEMYSFGINWIFNIFAIVLIVPILNWVVIPVFYNNNISNCYEYLELRFNRGTRQLLTIVFMGTLFLMLPIFIFIPSLAFSQVSGLNIHLINAVVCSICIIYTMLGGIKAIVWTDVVQAAVMVASVVIVGVLGAVKVGGVSKMLSIAHKGRRLDVSFAFDATTRVTFWNSSITSIVLWVTYVGLHQSCVQRIVSLPSLKHARHALIIFGLGFFVIMFFTCFTGIIMYALYHDCDPITRGYVQKLDKMVPFFVQDVVGHLSGMPGLFISCVFSAALSTMSASLNSLAGVVYFDYIKPHVKHTERKANLIMRAFICASGVYSIISGFLVEKFASILQMVYSIGGVTFGSVFGVFLLGMLVPLAHGRAAFWSVITSIITMCVIIIGAQGRLHYNSLPMSVENCTATNATVLLSSTSTIGTTPTPSITESFNIFHLSFNWYAVTGSIVLFLVAIPLSYILPVEQNYKLNLKLLSPVLHPFLRYELPPTEELPELKPLNFEK